MFSPSFLAVLTSSHLFCSVLLSLGLLQGVCAYALKHGNVPGSVLLSNLAEGCDLDYLAGENA